MGSTAPHLDIYGMGFVGTSLVRVATARGWPIVAAYNRAGEKVGQDAGVLAGIGELGVIVEDCDAADYSASGADVGVVSVLAPEVGAACFPAYERFLTAGVNVIALGSRLYNPRWYYPELTVQIDGLARRNGVTFLGAGLWDMTRIWPGLLAAGASERIDSIDYVTLIEPLAQGVHWGPMCGIGRTLDEFKQVHEQVPHLRIYEGLGVMVLQYHGYTVADVRMTHEPIVAEEETYSSHLCRSFPAGMCIGLRLRIDVESVEGVVAHGLFDFRILRTDEVEFGTWTINGLPRMQVSVQREDVDMASATSALNRVPDVISADPGLTTIMRLGPLRPVTRGDSLRRGTTL